MSEGWYEGMDGEFARRLRALIEASQGRVTVGSGYRSIEEQTYLWNKAVNDYGPEEARNWVAPPGKSNHNHGVAADLDWMSDDALQWAHDNAARYGLVFPMSWEPWHIEPMGVREGTYGVGGDVEAYTTVPAGATDPVDPINRQDLGYQLASLNSLLMRPIDPSALQSGGGVGEMGAGVLNGYGQSTTTALAAKEA